ncbi:100K [Ovine adenovirus 7]|uniref:100K n=1 Tax=Ovine adenovirus D serotype 7 (isolate OAV287) TaxID=114430 RepID=Q83890_ADEO7|nr:100K [Ovine adenovirus 7]AAA73916.1 100K [Ovine adenovirus 7]
MAEKNMGESEKGLNEEEFNSILSKHLERQIKICKALTSKLSNWNIGTLLENLLFCPDERQSSGDPDPKLNFYPPFLIPECLALHYPFFLTTPIPLSCKANKIGTNTYRKWMNNQVLDLQIPSLENCKWDDSLGNVDLIEELKENQKLVLVKQDHERNIWFKSKCKQLQSFSYPSLSLPPVLQQVLIESLIGISQDPNNFDKNYEPAITLEKLQHVNCDQDLKQVQQKVSSAATYGILLKCIQTLFSDKLFIQNCQESLHYTFNHGYVKLLQFLTNVSLSEFVTFHGLTHRNRLNNPQQHTQLATEDKIDYIIDTVYLFLVFTWQTAMDIWNQTLDDKTINIIKEELNQNFEKIVKAESVDEVSEILKSIIFPELMLRAFCSNLPDFINQSQISNFRNFICIKSGIPQSICPLLPSDLIPLTFLESHPILWSHVMLLNLASFLVNQGNYLHEPEKPLNISSVYCNCNLCSPQRMPCYNSSLMQEILTIDKFEFTNSDKTKQLKLTLQTFANAYLNKFNSAEFYHDQVLFYKNCKSKFSNQLTACVIKDEKLLAKIAEIQITREKELLKRGKGIYLDPETGEILNNGEAISSSENFQRQRTSYALPSNEGERAGWEADERRRRRRSE